MGAERDRVAEFGKLENGLRQAGDWYRWRYAAALGASHQTGWTGLIADVIRRRYGLVRPIGDVIMVLGQQSRP